MADYQLTRFQDDDPEDLLYDIQVFESFNRFGRHAVAYIDDFDGNRSDRYPRGTGVTVDVDPEMDGTFEELFVGWVMETKEEDQNGADQLVVTIYSFDHFLRRNQISRDFSSDTIFEALQAIIEDFTPVIWDAANVSVSNNATLTRSFRGERVDNAISEFASKSANEEFGVNDDIEFYFQPRETDEAPREIANDEWFHYDFPDSNAEALNEVQLFFGEGENTGSVIVDRGSDKQELEDSLGLAGPAVLREEVTIEAIDNVSDARSKAEEILQGREPVQIGEVTTFGLFDAEPGDVISVEIEPRDIDTEFRIAELDYEWGAGTTTLTLVEKRGNQDETLVRLTDTLDRVEGRAADRDAVATRFVDTRAGAEFSATLTFVIRELGDSRFIPGFGRDSLGFGRSYPGLSVVNAEQVASTSAKVTNALLDAVRDGWSGDGNPTINSLAIGDGTSTPSRTDTQLGNELDAQSASAETSGTKTVRWQGTFSVDGQTDLQEGGVETASDLMARARLTDAITPDRSVLVRFEIVTSDGDRSGVVTNDGQESVRDILADNSPDLPANIAFGSDDTTPTEDDTALGNEVTRETIDSFEFGQTGVVDVIADIPADTETGEILGELGQTSNGDLLTRSAFAEFAIEATQRIVSRDNTRFTNE